MYIFLVTIIYLFILSKIKQNQKSSSFRNIFKQKTPQVFFFGCWKTKIQNVKMHQKETKHKKRKQISNQY